METVYKQNNSSVANVDVVSILPFFLSIIFLR